MHLSDCFANVITYVTLFLESPDKDNRPFEKVHAEITALLTASDDCLKNGEFSPEDYSLAKFAICAWIDERILESDWKDKAQWQRQQLQRLFFNTTHAGEEFFEKMNLLGPHQGEVREIYFTCLCLGFMGRYCGPKDEYLLEQLKASNLKILLGASTSVPKPGDNLIFPEAYPMQPSPTEAPGRGWRITPFTLCILASPVVLFAILFIVYNFILRGVGENVMALI